MIELPQNPTLPIHGVVRSAFINQITCIDWQEGIKQVLNESIDLVVTDPPYGMQFQSNFRNVKHKSIQNDDNLKWLGGWCKELKRKYANLKHTLYFCKVGIK